MCPGSAWGQGGGEEGWGGEGGLEGEGRGPPGPVVKASASRAADPGFDSCLLWDFSGWSHTSDLKVALQGLPCQAPGVPGSALGLVSPLSVYCDRVR